MSLASVQHAKLHVSLSANSLNLLDELIPSRWLTNDPKPAAPRDDIPIEFKTCFTCGVNWYDDHVSLDCPECGGYSLERPCADCEGKCGAVWERDLQKSHAYKRPFWMGKCQAPGSSQDKMDVDQKKTDASEGLSMRLDKLSVKNS